MKKKIFLLSVVILLVSFLLGCASIVSESYWPVRIRTKPVGAKCLVSKGNGTPVHRGETPMTINLSSSNFPFWPATYTVKCSKIGYLDSSSEFSAFLNPWYAGNIVIGGLIGLLIVDPLTGAMWRLSETHIVNLVKDESMPSVDQSQNPILEKNNIPTREVYRYQE